MGFFKDFKRDFAQAVNELMPDKDELGAEYDDEDMVNTFDEKDQMDVAPEDMMDDLSEIQIDKPEVQAPIPEQELENEKNNSIPEADEIKDKTEDAAFDVIPDAEVIQDELELAPEPFSEDELEQKPELEYLQAETEPASEEIEEMTAENKEPDELKALDELDEPDMLEHTEEALAIEPDTEQKEEMQNFMSADLGKAVEDTLAKQAEEESLEMTRKQEESALDQSITKSEEKNDVDALMEADTTYITKTTTINGDVQTDGCIDLIGTVNGAVSCDGKLIIGGTVQGNVTVGELYANAARIEGDVHVNEAAKIGVGTVVVGNVFAGSAVIAGAIKGDIDVQGPVIVDSTAVIMGNIKSKSVQINNGAVIEGMCSQCYSEIDVKSFFE